MDRPVAAKTVVQRDEDALKDGLPSGDVPGGVIGFGPLEDADPGPDRWTDGWPRSVEGAISTSGLRWMRFIFPALSKVRTKAWLPSTAMVTGVPTRVPSRR